MSKPRRRKPLGRRLRPARRSWEAVWQGDLEANASIVAGGLDADGIPARVQGSQAVRGYFGMWLAPDHWAVVVPGSHADKARDILRDRGDEAGVVENTEMDADAAFDLGFKLLLSFVGLILVVLAYSAFRTAWRI